MFFFVQGFLHFVLFFPTSLLSLPISFSLYLCFVSLNSSIPIHFLKKKKKEKKAKNKVIIIILQSRGPIYNLLILSFHFFFFPSLFPSFTRLTFSTSFLQWPFISLLPPLQYLVHYSCTLEDFSLSLPFLVQNYLYRSTCVTFSRMSPPFLVLQISNPLCYLPSFPLSSFRYYPLNRPVSWISARWEQAQNQSKK